MIPAIIFTVSLAAFAQFIALYWRAMIHGVATQAISERFREATRITNRPVGATDFRSIMGVYEMAPDLRGPSKALGAIRSYYWMVEKVGGIAPTLKSWAETEMTACSRYAAVLVDQHLASNMACAAEMRGL
jgi:hypothetical protein